MAKPGTPRVLVGIHQLHYVPWLRYFEKIARTDVFIVLDNIQFNKNGWQNRNKIKSATGVPTLTVPVFETFAQNLDEVRIRCDVPWRRKHWQSIRQSYAKASFFSHYAGFLEHTWSQDWQMLNDLNRHMLPFFLGALGITTPVVYASDVNVPGTATERLVNLIKAVGGDTYYSGAYATEVYLDAGMLQDAGIGLELQRWRAPAYPQLHGGFVPDLSIIDLLMNCGPDSLDVLMGGAA
ncbi:MAG TPA: WbqC family protein [Candidatus Bathyarchaeia archaeon]|nr:WbqC family protein [Candidatus Bathyarchaeia archaeon]